MIKHAWTRNERRKGFQAAITACYSLVNFSQKHKIISLSNTSFIQHFAYLRSLIHSLLLNKNLFYIIKLLTSEARLTFNGKAKAKIIKAQSERNLQKDAKQKLEC